MPLKALPHISRKIFLLQDYQIGILGISFFLLLPENKYPYEIVGPRALVSDVRGVLTCEIRVLLELGHIKTKKASKRYDLSLKPLVGTFRKSFFI
jgi:hypothetical protein